MSSFQPNANQLLDFYEEKLIKAAKLFNFISLTTKNVIPNFQFDHRQAMIDVAIPDTLAASQAFTAKFLNHLYAEMDRNRLQSFEQPTSEKIIVKNMKIILEILHPHTPSETMHLFSLAGFREEIKKTDDGRVDRKDYDRVSKKLRRALKAFQDAHPADAVAAPLLDFAPAPIQTVELLPRNGDRSSIQLLSPMTLNGQRASTDSSSMVSSLSQSQDMTTSYQNSSSIHGGSQTSSTTSTTIRSQRQCAIASSISDSSSLN